MADRESGWRRLDRIHPDLGYWIFNILPCCARCNEMRGAATAMEWLTLLTDINEGYKPFVFG